MLQFPNRLPSLYKSQLTIHHMHSTKSHYMLIYCTLCHYITLYAYIPQFMPLYHLDRTGHTAPADTSRYALTQQATSVPKTTASLYFSLPFYHFTFH